MDSALHPHQSEAPLHVRRPTLFRAGLPVILALLTIDGIALARGAGRAAAPEPAHVALRSEKGPGGHATIGVNEALAQAQALTFAQLGTWDFRPTAAPPCPPAVQGRDGHDGTLTGFMYPLSPGDRVTGFCLLRSTQTCCFGPRPQYNQYVLVETREAVPFERLRPVQVSGLFKVDPQPTQGFIYRMEGAVVAPVPGFEAPVDAMAHAQANRLTLWDWGLISGLAAADQSHPVLPPGLLALADTTVVVEGYVHQREAGPPAQLVLGANPPPGRPNGKVPTQFTAMTTTLASTAGLPADWQDQVVVQGVLRVTADAAKWDDEGIVHLDGANICRRPPASPLAALIAVALAQVAAIAGFLYFTLGRRRPPPSATP